jgi:hypothetical protein
MGFALNLRLFPITTTSSFKMLSYYSFNNSNSIVLEHAVPGTEA